MTRPGIEPCLSGHWQTLYSLGLWPVWIICILVLTKPGLINNYMVLLISSIIVLFRNVWGCPHAVLVKAMDSGIVVKRV